MSASLQLLLHVFQGFPGQRVRKNTMDRMLIFGQARRRESVLRDAASGTNIFQDCWKPLRLNMEVENQRPEDHFPLQQGGCPLLPFQ